VPEHSEFKRQIYATTSDTDGHFLLKDVVPGRYQFFATRAGFVNQQYQAKGNDDGAVLSLKAGDTVSDALFRMTVSGVVTGRVTNEDGEAMIRVQVVALRWPSEDEIEDEASFTSRKRDLRAVSSAQTDDRGQYRIFGLKPGEYYIKATDSFEPDRNISVVDESYWVQEFLGSEYAPVYFPDVAQASQAQVVSVKSWQRGAGRRFHAAHQDRGKLLDTSLAGTALPKIHWCFSHRPEWTTLYRSPRYN